MQDLKQKSLGKALGEFMEGLDFSGAAHTAEASSDAETSDGETNDSENSEENGSVEGSEDDLAEEEAKTKPVSNTRNSNTPTALNQATKTVKTARIDQDEQPSSETASNLCLGWLTTYHAHRMSQPQHPGHHSYLISRCLRHPSPLSLYRRLHRYALAVRLSLTAFQPAPVPPHRPTQRLFPRSCSPVRNRISWPPLYCS